MVHVFVIPEVVTAEQVELVVTVPSVVKVVVVQDEVVPGVVIGVHEVAVVVQGPGAVVIDSKGLWCVPGIHSEPVPLTVTVTVRSSQ